MHVQYIHVIKLLHLLVIEILSYYHSALQRHVSLGNYNSVKSPIPLTGWKEVKKKIFQVEVSDHFEAKQNIVW